ncbi:hypothetical protein [Halorubrum trueperi]|uniref:Amidohydrolase n=1 Tax=Halorubrum trueperi TaxID=2004704 RepID=A0ABD5UMD7_9EURY
MIHCELRTHADCHIHLFPQRLRRAIRGSLNDAAGGEFPHPDDPTAVEATLRDAGTSHYSPLPYAHEADMAADRNDWELDWAADSRMCIPSATADPETSAQSFARPSTVVMGV